MADQFSQVDADAGRRRADAADLSALRLSLDGSAVVLANEFATVLVSADDTANGPRLRVLDPSSGRQIYLDPLELQALAWARHEMLDGMLQPRFKEEQVNSEDLADPMD